MTFAGIYQGRRVLVTGHTGFKGSWLSLWLEQLGATVGGFSIDVPTVPSNFGLLRLEHRMHHRRGDVRNRVEVARMLDDFKPDIIFHLAAQSLVKRAYEDPVATFETNAMGMVNLLECVRERPSIQVAVLVTSDKAYRNNEWCWGYRETDALGGHDPYGGSKSCAELVAYSYFQSFLRDSPTRIATARAGNVIGGGDWAADRIVPDCVRAWSRADQVEIRNPRSTRPWQHVLEPLSGYLWLGARLWHGAENVNGEAFNFGPDARVNQTVGELMTAMASRWPSAQWRIVTSPDSREATLLRLSCDKALHHLKWRTTLEFDETVSLTVDWYRAWHRGTENLPALAGAQIEHYCELARKRSVPWNEGPTGVGSQH
jgi:CDP-glucose 4,6-dehydratase